MWRIRDWNRYFEKAQSRAAAKSLSWVSIPNKHDSCGFSQLIEHDHGVMHYGAWCLLVQIASKCRPRGYLVRDGGIPHTFESIGRMVRVSASVFREAIPRFIEIGWLEDIADSTPSERYQSAMSGKMGKDEPQDVCATDVNAAPSERYERAMSRERKNAPTGQDRTGQDRTEQDIPASAGSSASDEPTTEPSTDGVKGSGSVTAEPAVLMFPTVGRGPSEWAMTQAFFDELVGLYPNVDVLAECKKALLKIRNKAVTAKTARGMPRFLYAWMDRSQNASRAGGGDGSRQRSLPTGSGQVHPDDVGGGF